MFDLLFPNSSRCTVPVQDCLLGSMFGQVALMPPVWLTPLMQGVGRWGGIPGAQQLKEQLHEVAERRQSAERQEQYMLEAQAVCISWESQTLTRQLACS